METGKSIQSNITNNIVLCYEDKIVSLKEKLTKRIDEILSINNNKKVNFNNEIFDNIFNKLEEDLLRVFEIYSKSINSIEIDSIKNEDINTNFNNLEKNPNLSQFSKLEEIHHQEFKILEEIKKSDLNSLKSKEKIKKKKNINLIKTIPNNSGGMFFHPRELINDEILITGGRGGVLKFWDIKYKNFELILEIDTGVQWITRIKYDSKFSLIFCSTYAEYLFIFYFNKANKKTVHIKTLKVDGLTQIHGFDCINNNQFSLLAISGFSENSETVLIYENKSGKNLDYQLSQSIVPFEHSNNKKKYSKSLKFCESLNLLVIGLQDGEIEVYILNEKTRKAEFSYHINLSNEDWVYQIQIIKHEDTGNNYILASNANCFYYVYFDCYNHKILKKRNFLGSIHDFYYVNSNGEVNFEFVFMKLKTSLVVVYDLVKDEILESVDESKKKGLYDHCLIASKKERCLFSLRDNDILIYNF